MGTSDEHDGNYEFSSAFRGESYEWYPAPPSAAPDWQDTLVHCLRNQVTGLTLEARDGRRWSVDWTAQNRNRVRGGSLQVVAIDGRPSQTEHDIEDGAAMHTAVGLVTRAGVWTATESTWLQLCDATSELCELLTTIGVEIPDVAAMSEDADVLRALADLAAPAKLVILAQAESAPSAVGELLLAWSESSGWLAERVGGPRLSAVELLGPAHREPLFKELDGLAACAGDSIFGWDKVERTLTSFDEFAARWSASSPTWQVKFDADAREPVLDVRGGVVVIPGDGDVRRARKLAARLGASPGGIGEPSVAATAQRNGKLVSWVVAAFALGLVCGVLGAYFWMLRLVCQ